MTGVLIRNKGETQTGLRRPSEDRAEIEFEWLQTKEILEPPDGENSKEVSSLWNVEGSTALPTP